MANPRAVWAAWAAEKVQTEFLSLRALRVGGRGRHWASASPPEKGRWMTRSVRGLAVKTGLGHTWKRRGAWRVGGEHLALVLVTFLPKQKAQCCHVLFPPV